MSRVTRINNINHICREFGQTRLGATCRQGRDCEEVVLMMIMMQFEAVDKTLFSSDHPRPPCGHRQYRHASGGGWRVSPRPAEVLRPRGESDLQLRVRGGGRHRGLRPHQHRGHSGLPEGDHLRQEGLQRVLQRWYHLLKIRKKKIFDEKYLRFARGLHQPWRVALGGAHLRRRQVHRRRGSRG